LPQVRNPATGAVYILLEAQLDKVPGAVPKAKKGKAKGKDEPPDKGFEVRWHGVCFRLHKFRSQPSSRLAWQPVLTVLFSAYSDVHQHHDIQRSSLSSCMEGLLSICEGTCALCP